MAFGPACREVGSGLGTQVCQALQVPGSSTLCLADRRDSLTPFLLAGPGGWARQSPPCTPQAAEDRLARPLTTLLLPSLQP